MKNLSIKTYVEKLMNESNLPPGAENDPRAPYNQEDNAQVEKYTINYDGQYFDVLLDNGNTFQTNFIDILERYWRQNKNSFEQHHQMFGDDDATTDVNIIKYLRDNKVDFEPYLWDEAESLGLV